jgi:hypothetical protein
MKKINLLFAFLLFCFTGKSQDDKNYIIEINGDTVSVGLDQTTVFQTRDGKSLNIRLKQKETIIYSDKTLSFQYPATYSISKKDLGNDIEQLLLMSALGNGFIIQKYGSINPEFAIDLMLNEITRESKDAGYKEKIQPVEKKISSGETVKGKISTLSIDKDSTVYTAVACGKKRGGILVIEIKVNQSNNAEADKKLLTLFWETLKLK